MRSFVFNRSTNLKKEMSGKDSFSFTVLGGILGIVVTILLGLTFDAINVAYIKSNLPKILWFTVSGTFSICGLWAAYTYKINNKTVDFLSKNIEETHISLSKEIEANRNDNLEQHKEIKVELAKKAGVESYNALNQRMDYIDSSQKEIHKMFKAIYDERVQALQDELSKIKKSKNK
jgi:hypothetical protein